MYKARTRLAQVTIVDPAAPGAVRPVGGFEASEVARVMGELNADPARNYGTGAMRKAAIAEAITRTDARQQCWGSFSLTRWLLLDNERRSRRWESLAHDMRGLKVRYCTQPVACCARIQFSRRGGGARLSVLETKSPVCRVLGDPITDLVPASQLPHLPLRLFIPYTPQLALGFPLPYHVTTQL